MAESTLPAARYTPPKLDDTLTRENLEATLRDESVAAVEAAWFARIAEIEGEPEAARALREIAEQHQVNARGTLDLLLRAREPLTGKIVGATARNVEALQRFYADDAHAEERRASVARREGFSDIGSWFESVGRLRAAHAARLASLDTPEGE